MEKIRVNSTMKFVLYLFNFMVLTINFILLYKKKIKSVNKFKSKEIGIYFKHADDFLYLAVKSYQSISNYLDKKYDSNIIKNETKTRKKLSLNCVDQLNSISYKYRLKKILDRRYTVRLDGNKPDYLVYDVFGKEHLNPKYNNSIKIAIYTENKIPDFSVADYAFAQAHISYLDRYFKYPSFLWRNLKSIKYWRKKILNNPMRTKFCCAIISNNISTDGFRLKFIDELSKYKKVDMGGRYNNNIGGQIRDKIKFLSLYKFSIAMENSGGDGYISEKMINSFITGTIPIYYGDYMVDEYINPKSLILVKNEKNFQAKIDYIKEIDKDNEKYLKILNESVILNENIPYIIYRERQNFFYNIFEQETNRTKRIGDE